MPHKHHKEMMAYAEDAAKYDEPWLYWECKNSKDHVPEWSHFMVSSPCWHNYCEYRRKPCPININGHEVPEPVREPLEMETDYFTPRFSGDAPYSMLRWQRSGLDYVRLKYGTIHLTKEAATQHAEALLSFTAISDREVIEHDVEILTRFQAFALTHKRPTEAAELILSLQEKVDPTEGERG